MGLIHPRYRDAFISYAHRDNELTNRFVHQFHRVLTGWFTAQFGKESTATSDVFLDREGLHQNGSLEEELRRAVRESVFLFVFVGAKYPESTWSLTELEHFLDPFDGQLPNPRDRVFLIIMNPEGAKGLDRIRDKMPPTVRALALDNIRSYFHDQRGNALDVYDSIEEGVQAKAFRERFGLITSTLTQRIDDIRRRLPAPDVLVTPSTNPTVARVSETTPKVLLGVVTPDLVQSRNALTAALERRGIRVDAVEVGDLVNPQAEDTFVQRLRDCRAFVQAFSPHSVLLDFQPGGHLALQAEFVGDRRIWWWDALAAGQAAQRDGGATDVARKHARFFQEVRTKAHTGSAEALAEEIALELSPPPVARVSTEPVSASVLIESSDDEPSKWFMVKKRLQEEWFARFRTRNILCNPLPFRGREPDELARRRLSGCHGVILLLGNKQHVVLQHQAECVEDQLLKLSGGAEQAIACFLPPQEPDSVDRTWFTVPFRENDGRLEEIALPTDKPPLAGQRLATLIDLIHTRASVGAPTS
jgi:hypothetical protein